MRKFLIALGLFLAGFSSAAAQCNGNFPANDVCGSIAGGFPGPVPGTSLFTGITVGSSPVNNGTNTFVLTDNAGVLGNISPSITINGTTCTLASSCSPTAVASSVIVGTTTISGGTNGNVEFNNSGVLGEKGVTGTGSVVLQTSPSLITPSLGVASATSLTLSNALTISNGGTGQTTQQAAFNALAPTATRAGDLTYWNGTNYVNLTGNNSGTQILTENSSGVPSWAATGSVSSVTCGTGLSGGTITTTGTCAVSLVEASNVLGGDVNLSSTSTYFDGPSTNCGSACTTGTWYASSSVTVLDTAGAAIIYCKLWDGTTVISSGAVDTGGGNAPFTIALSGYLPSPGGNLKVSCKDITATTGKIKFNTTGNSADSSVFVHRIN